MATISLKTSTLFNVVSITKSTKTIVVSGDARDEIANTLKIRVANSPSGNNGVYNVNGNPSYAGGNTTIVVSESPTSNQGAGGTVNLMRNGNTSTSWVGDSLPTASDTASIGSGADCIYTAAPSSAYAIAVAGKLYISSGVGLYVYNNIALSSGAEAEMKGETYYYGSLTAASGAYLYVTSNYGYITLASSNSQNAITNHYGYLVVESTGYCRVYHAYGMAEVRGELIVEMIGMAYGQLVVEPGGYVRLDQDAELLGCILVMGGGYAYFDNAYNSGCIIALSDSAVRCGMNYGFLGYYTGATLAEGTTGYSFGTERRMTNYTGQLSDKIQIIGEEKTLLEVSGPSALAALPPESKVERDFQYGFYAGQFTGALRPQTGDGMLHIKPD